MFSRFIDFQAMRYCKRTTLLSQSIDHLPFKNHINQTPTTTRM